ncbi:DgyrCDS6100 [Dimorphilus gyrociliatus]|uniref:DgyrCDS6100 n=1 Tax=Dimorphilus gyrociliatus TaxID=2664684 RepID=A0A7I8VM56_9ANNE|nr:DgyrCDS6100 [Dimorphilus gyrociliatus]
MSNSKLAAADYAAVVIYFLAVIGVGLYSMFRTNRGTVSGYFLAGRFITFLPVGASLFASNIGSEHFIGLAGSGAAAGIAVGAFEFNACILLQLLGWVFLPVYIASGVNTLPEYMKKRFGGKRIRIYLASLSLILYIFTKISVNLYAGAVFIQQALDWNLYVSVLLILTVTAICTVSGGLAAVIYTDTLQAFIMMVGATTLSIISFVKVGGYKGLYDQFESAIPNSTLMNPNTTCGIPPNDSWTMLRDPMSKSMPWPGFLFGQTPASIWYWCADQMMVQRTLAAKSLSHAQGGTLTAGYMKLLPFFVMVLPGMISRVLFPNEVACATSEQCMKVCGSKVSCTNIAYPKLVLELMPDFMRGVMLSVMLSALMSDLTSIFNSASTLFTLDFYATFRKKATNRELMIVGRIAIIFLTIIGIIWIPVVESMQGGQLYIYIQSISAYLAPPIAAVYLLAVLSKRCNELGAFCGLISGFVVGVIRMILDFVYKEPRCGDEDERPRLIRLHYMYFATILFWLTIIVSMIVSFLTVPPSLEQLTCTTFWTRFSERDDNETIELEDVNTDIEISETKKKTSIWQWFCGLNASKFEIATSKERLKTIQSLQQNETAKIILKINLVVILILSGFLYIFFSSNHFGLLD